LCAFVFAEKNGCSFADEEDSEEAGQEV